MNWQATERGLNGFEQAQARRKLIEVAESQVLYEALDALQGAIRAMDEAALYVALAKTEAAMSLYQSTHKLGSDAARHSAAST